MFLDFGRVGSSLPAFLANPLSEENEGFIKDNGLKVSKTPKLKGKEYYIVRHDKNWEAKEGYEVPEWRGLFRSVIVNNGRIVSVGMPKCVSRENFEEKVVDMMDTYISIFEEGPMVNMFYVNSEENGHWQIATRSVVGGVNSFFGDESGKRLTFRQMFFECMPDGLEEQMNKERVYSFVLKHPKNRDVYKVERPGLICLGSFSSDTDGLVWNWNREEIYIAASDTSCWSINHFACETEDYNKILKDEENMGYGLIGVEENGGIVRCKSLNERYRSLRALRGTGPSLLYHFLTLRKERGAVKRYLEAFKEHSNEFANYRHLIHDFTSKLQHNYWDCFVNKSKPFKDYDTRYKQCMYDLHGMFKKTKTPVNYYMVVDYVNNMEPSKLIYRLTFDRMSKRNQKVKPNVEMTKGDDADMSADEAEM